ncbi:hypothetical protein EON66_09275 [archaeon]|nr:MAG: hypothetical protein EON66_09275 [archaeon]
MCRSFDPSLGELARYVHVDASKKYSTYTRARPLSFVRTHARMQRYLLPSLSVTLVANAARNLIATNEDFTLMLLCWNAGRASPIHDHPGHGCWMRVVDGSVTETRYRCDGELNKMVQTSFAQANAGDVIYIDDNIAFHKVGNPSETELAFSLHLYSPPFNSCSIWLEDTPADKVRCFCTHTRVCACARVRIQRTASAQCFC